MSIRRISLEGYAESLVDLLGDRFRMLPNTSGCVTARDAMLTAELAREASETDWVKLELIGDRETLYPDVEQLVQAADELVRKGFVVLPYCNEDPVTCRKLADVGCAAVMPLGSLIGSGMGIANPCNIELICARSPVPVVLDAGIGTASDAVLAMELGCDAVMVNTAIAKSHDPRAHGGGDARSAVEGGAWRALAGRIPKRALRRAVEPAARPDRLSLPAPLLVITDRRGAARPLEEVVAAALRGGCRWLSLREKDLASEERLALLERIVGLARPFGATVMVHGDLEAAKVFGDRCASAGRRLAGAGARTARQGSADRPVGAQWRPSREPHIPLPTTLPSARSSPRSASPATGRRWACEGLADAAEGARLPIVALGGMTAANLGSCLAAGAAAVAVMGTVMAAADPEATMAALLRAAVSQG